MNYGHHTITSAASAATSSNQLFAGKVVLVTGGNTGIGRATAVAFARHGAHLVVSGRRKAEGEESVAIIEKVGGKGMFVHADVSR
jgi:NAD(P)-dependent dehydrogenase (short-subunit alcohol dehydrogenase family)